MFTNSFASKCTRNAAKSLITPLLLFCFAPHPASAQTPRPPITGISHMCVYSTDLSATSNFYTEILGAFKANDPENPAGDRFYFGPTQFVEVLPLPPEQQSSLSRMSCVAFSTPKAESLRAYLVAKGVTDISPLQTASDKSRWFKTKDPEGNEIQFVEPGKPPTFPPDAKPISTRIIHVGFLVHSKPAEDHFFHDILGFRPYWFGAMQPDRVDWVSQQVPDGHDWLEYMLVGDGSTTPLDHLNARELGVLNHFSLGVPNMEAAVTTLYAQDRLPPRHDGPQMGKDGKWQANLYDPDGTRVELMEFQPVMKPCCSDFTATSPTK